MRVTSHQDGNLAFHTNDDPDVVARNRVRLAATLPGLPVWLRQVHGNDVVTVSAIQHAEITADASYTKAVDTPLGILVADCLPVLITSTDGLEIAAIHAGWRGLADRIIERTVTRFDASSLVATLGPCIGPCHYEVDAIVRDRMAPEEQRIGFVANREGHFRMSLQQIARYQLGQCGVDVLREDDRCTACSAVSNGEDHLYSHRLGSQMGKPEIRRFAALIWREVNRESVTSSCPG
ncbi:MAG: peptidoglycan editing factor PgeF [Pseudomonadota bacterium]